MFCLTPCLHQTISIHALLAESDAMASIYFHGIFYFYPRSPCGERLRNQRGKLMPYAFLSTLSLRRATSLTSNAYAWTLIFLSTLSLRRATPDRAACCCGLPQFLSTLSLRRATDEIAKLKGLTGISIHALLAESDR